MKIATVRVALAIERVALAVCHPDGNGSRFNLADGIRLQPEGDIRTWPTN